jgi:hypothetical protein
VFSGGALRLHEGIDLREEGRQRATKLIGKLLEKVDHSPRKCGLESDFPGASV